MKMDIQIKTINDAKERDDSFESTATISFKMNNASAWACPAEITVCGKTKEEAEKLLQEELNEAFSPSAQARREAFDRAIEIVGKLENDFCDWNSPNNFESYKGMDKVTPGYVQRKLIEALAEARKVVKDL